MFPFKCFKCSSISFPAGGLDCLSCRSYALTDAAISDKFHTTQPLVVSSKNTNEASESSNPLVQTDMQTVISYNGNRNKSNDRVITENKERNKQPIQKLCVKSGLNLLPDCKPDSKNRDLEPETIAAENHMASENCHSIDMHREILNNDIIETLSYNQGMHSPDHIAKSRLFPISQSNASNIGTLQSENGPRKIPYTGESTLESRYLDDILAVPGPSGFHRNRNNPNKSIKKLQSRNPQEIPSVEPGNEKEFICPVCNDEIVKHAIADGRAISYICCVCKHKTDKKIHLVIHSYIHGPRKICNICEKEYAEGNNHESEHRCSLCQKIFQCKTDLDEHSLNDHLKYFSTHCWVCRKSINDHIPEKEAYIIYVCCLCGSRNRDRKRFMLHNKTHFPKFFCKLCKEEYLEGEKSYHNKEHTCMVCDKKFQCKGFLEDHSGQHENNFSKYCRVCKVEISKHKMKKGTKSLYNCCRCKSAFELKSNFQTHLYTHTNLRLFKCDVCGRRYKRNRALRNHSLTCIPLPYKCKVCSARFPDNGSLNIHYLKKHSQIREETQV